MAIEPNSLLWSRPGMNGGRLCASGTAVSVLRIAACYLDGMSAEQIVDDYPQLTLAAVHAALAYYFANRDEMDEQLREEVAEYNRLAAAESVKRAASA